MRNILWVLLFTTLSTTVAASNSDYDVEEIIVVGAYIVEGRSDAEYDDNLLESIMPTKSYVAGGPGAFQGIMLNGTDTKHTAVYKNGVPVNDPSSGWFDFGTELISGQNTKLISGPNSVQFGSGSMAGVVLIDDDLSIRETIIKGANDKAYVFTSLEGLQLIHYKGTNGSARSDNTEEDWYENTTLKFGGDVNDWIIRGEFTDYTYDYDNCWTETPNNCVQDGEKTFFSARNDKITLGYMGNEATHNTGFELDTERFYLDATVYEAYGMKVGITGQKETYNELDRDIGAVWFTWTDDRGVSVGLRYEDDAEIIRVGYENDDVKVSVGNSYRRPNLYEENGDDWVAANPNLLPEEGIGAEVTWNKFSVFYNEFSEGIEFDMSAYQYVNTGSYDAHGVKYMNQWLMDTGSIFFSTTYTQTDKIRVPDWMTKISYWTAGNIGGMTWTGEIAYISELNKGKDFDGREIDDVDNFDIRWSIEPAPRHTLMFAINDVFDNNFEVLPDYPAGGREFSLSYRVSY
tara:strand:- start:14299 stop:15849 length:1551 start_codon:yes stop_codon:yes gene_type:complete